FHGDVGLAFMLFDGINGANSGMIERRSRTSFAQKALHGRGVRLAGILKELQRHAASQPSVLGFIHHTHPAASQLPQDAIVPNSFVDHGIVPESCSVALRYSPRLTLRSLRLRADELSYL